jgi:hypothetical protein
MRGLLVWNGLVARVPAWGGAATPVPAPGDAVTSRREGGPPSRPGEGRGRAVGEPGERAVGEDPEGRDAG